MKKLLIPLFALSTLAAAGQTEGKNQTDHAHLQPDFRITLGGTFKNGTYKGADGELGLVLALPFEKGEIEFEFGGTKELGNKDPHGRRENDIVPHFDMTGLINVGPTGGFQVGPTIRLEKGNPELLKREFLYLDLPKGLKLELGAMLRYNNNQSAYYIALALGNFLSENGESDFSGALRGGVVYFLGE